MKFEYLALNLKKVFGPALETKLNELGAQGWETGPVAKDYLILKRAAAS